MAAYGTKHDEIAPNVRGHPRTNPDMRNVENIFQRYVFRKAIARSQASFQSSSRIMCSEEG